MATEGRGEARRKLVSELGLLNGLELAMLSPGYTKHPRLSGYRLLCRVKLFLTHPAVLRSLPESAQWVQKTFSFHSTRGPPSLSAFIFFISGNSILQT